MNSKQWVDLIARQKLSTDLWHRAGISLVVPAGKKISLGQGTGGDVYRSEAPLISGYPAFYPSPRTPPPVTADPITRESKRDDR